MDKIKKDLLTSWHERMVRPLISKMYEDQHEKKILKCEANTLLNIWDCERVYKWGWLDFKGF